MAKSRGIIVTGDKAVTRALNSLGSKKAREIHRKAMRKAARPVLEWARNIVPVVSGTYRQSLTIRALKKSRTKIGVVVTQREGQFKGKAFYGGFLEFGWRTGKRRSERTRRKIEGRWLMRKAGNAKEDEARGLYIAEVKKLIDAEWK